ncbi:MAG: sensor histidine kinase [Candidatus Thorarchaeota archaeon]
MKGLISIEKVPRVQSDLAMPRELRKDVPIGVVAASLIASGLYLSVIPSWDSIYTGVAFHSLLAFLAIIAAAWVFSEAGGRPPVYEFAVFSILATRAIIHLSASMETAYALGESFLIDGVRKTTTDIFELLLLGIVLFIAAMLHRRMQDAEVSWKMAPLLILILLLFDGIMVFWIVPALNNPSLQMLGTILSIIAFGSLILAAILRSRSPFVIGDRQTSILIISFVLFAISSIPLLSSLAFPSAHWAFAMVLESWGFFTFIIAIAAPGQLKWGMSLLSAFVVPIFFSMLSIAPFMVSIMATSWAPGFYAVELGAYYIAHLGAAVLSGVMGFLVYSYHKQKPQWVHIPLILLFLSWTYIEAHIVLFSNSETLMTLGESLVPYIVGSIASVIYLIRGIIWTRTPKDEELGRPELWIIPRLGIIIAMVVGGQFLEGLILAQTPGLTGSPLGRVILLGINFAAMFTFTHLGFLHAEKHKHWRSIEGYSVGVLALWIIPNYLKGNFDDWVLGWWAAEVFLLIGLLLGPALIGVLYLQEMIRSDNSRRRATLYSDILAHDISNLHQAMTVALGLMDMDDLPQDMLDMALQDARGCLRRADQLVRNVRGLGMTDLDEPPPLETIDLVGAIDHAIKQVLMELPDQTVEILVSRDISECFVTANGLLSDLFYNLFRNAIAYSREHRRIIVEIELIEMGPDSFWATKVIDFGKGIEPEKKATLFQRFMEGAEGTGLGLSMVYALTDAFGGTIAVSDRVEGDYTQGTVFTVNLPAII